MKPWREATNSWNSCSSRIYRCPIKNTTKYSHSSRTGESKPAGRRSTAYFTLRRPEVNGRVLANIFIAFANLRDRDHARSLTLMNRVRQGEFGQPYTSDYIFDESVTTALICTGNLTTAIKTGKLILGSERKRSLRW